MEKEEYLDHFFHEFSLFILLKTRRCDHHASQQAVELETLLSKLVTRYVSDSINDQHIFSYRLSFAYCPSFRPQLLVSISASLNPKTPFASESVSETMENGSATAHIRFSDHHRNAET